LLILSFFVPDTLRAAALTPGETYQIAFTTPSTATPQPNTLVISLLIASQFQPTGIINAALYVDGELLGIATDAAIGPAVGDLLFAFKSSSSPWDAGPPGFSQVIDSTPLTNGTDNAFIDISLESGIAENLSLAPCDGTAQVCFSAERGAEWHELVS
jgi:hypothetical protein